MKNILRSKIFIGAFLSAYFLFFVLTIYVFEVKTSGIGTGWWNYGFPFTYYFSTCWGGDYVWSGLFGNIFAAAISGFAVGVISVYAWRRHLLPFLRKISSEEFRAKWYI
jgi:hypothetical protein